MEITASAPGKIILTGEHSVVFGKPALTTAVNKRVTATLHSNNPKKQNSEIKIIDKRLGITEEFTINEIKEFTRQAKIKWEDFENSRTVNQLNEIAKNPLDLAKITIGESIKEQNPTGFTLEIKSDIPIGAGMGSSAALTACIVTAVFVYLKLSADKNFDLRQLKNDDLEAINKISLEAEKRRHGEPSGIDTTAVLNGGLIWYQRKDDDSRIMEQIKVNKNFLTNFTVVDTGRPRETTGEMVLAVRKKLERRKRWTQGILEKMEETSRKMLTGLTKEKPELVKEAIFENEKCLEKLGVVSEETKQFIRKLKLCGIPAKISGAGGRKDKSGMVICWGNKELINSTAETCNYKLLDISLGEEGTKIISQNN